MGSQDQWGVKAGGRGLHTKALRAYRIGHALRTIAVSCILLGLVIGFEATKHHPGGMRYLAFLVPVIIVCFALSNVADGRFVVHSDNTFTRDLYKDKMGVSDAEATRMAQRKNSL